MGIDTILVAVGSGEVDTATYVEAVEPLVESTGADVVLGHALSREEAQSAAENLGVDLDLDESAERPAETAEGAQTAPYQRLWPAGESPGSDEAVDDTVVGQFATVSALRTALDERGIPTDLAGSIGDPGPEIARLADRRGADLVVVGRRERSATAQALFGSASREIVERSPVPVVVASEA